MTAAQGSELQNVFAKDTRETLQSKAFFVLVYSSGQDKWALSLGQLLLSRLRVTVPKFAITKAPCQSLQSTA